MIDREIRLSSAGLRKREQILALALRASAGRRQRRLVLRWGLGCAAILGALSLLLRIEGRIENRTLSVPIHVHATDPIRLAPVLVPPPTSTPAPAPARAPSPNPPQRNREIVITRLQTDSRMTSRLAVHPAAESIQRIGDEQLLEELALAQQPAGLARLGGKTMLLFRNSPHSVHLRDSH